MLQGDSWPPWCPNIGSRWCRRTYARPRSARSSGVMPHFFPLQLLLATFAGWVNREQAQVVAYLRERNHQGLGNRLIVADAPAVEAKGEAVARERLGGLLR